MGINYLEFLLDIPLQKCLEYIFCYKGHLLLSLYLDTQNYKGAMKGTKGAIIAWLPLGPT